MLSSEPYSSSAALHSCCTARCGCAEAPFASRYANAPSGVKTSQRPSHANSSMSPGCTRATRTSGSATTSDAWKGVPGSEPACSLKSRSPSARETARAERTRPCETKPPAATIRFSSSGASACGRSTAAARGRPPEARA